MGLVELFSQIRMLQVSDRGTHLRKGAPGKRLDIGHFGFRGKVGGQQALGELNFTVMVVKEWPSTSWTVEASSSRWRARVTARRDTAGFRPVYADADKQHQYRRGTDRGQKPGGIIWNPMVFTRRRRRQTVSPVQCKRWVTGG